MNGILMFSAILWVFLDRAKKMWADVRFGNWITTAVATAAGMALAFGYGLDLLAAVGLTQAVTFGGQVFAGLAVAAGSSCINEIIEKTKEGEV